MHQHMVEDAEGQVVDAVALCSDACNRDYAGELYAGWNGAHSVAFTTWCAQCGVVIPGDCEDEDGQPCTCQQRNVVVNRFVTEEGVRCEHGNWVQLPARMLTRLNERSKA